MNENIEPPSASMIHLDVASVTTSTWGGGSPQVVFLHDGLGSIEQWRHIPAKVAASTGLTVMAYDRQGHGHSTPVPAGPWPADWLHTEANLLAELLDAVDAKDPLLVGHSDGGSIAAIHSATTNAMAPLVLLAAHSWVEPITVEAIAAMIRQRDRIVAGLSRYHDSPEALFDAWAGVWVGAEFATWDIRDLISSVACPTVVVQGSSDEYASRAHAHSTAAAIGSNATCIILEDVGHLIHHQAPDEIVELIAESSAGV